MSEHQPTLPAQDPTTPTDPCVAELTVLLGRLADLPSAANDATRIDRIAIMQQVKSALAAAQAREAVTFKESRLADERAAGVPAARRARSVGAEVALARRESPHQGSRLIGFAEALVFEMPHTFDALTKGLISEWRATLMVKETACLSRVHRTRVDGELADRMAALSDHQVEAEARRIAYRLDPHSVLNRSRRATADRRVTSRPQPDTMMTVSALLPAPQGAAVMAALLQEAAARRAAGDERSRGQVMADTFVLRVTGQLRADQTPVEIQLLVTDRTLFASAQTPAWLQGYGPVPAPFARDLLGRLDEKAKTWIRRFFTDPCTGLLSAVDTRRRLIAGPLRHALIVRDLYCRTPWCGAPIRHLDHVVPYQDGGETSESNAQGLCETCNYIKQAEGWTARPGPGGAGESVETTTPTGHLYTSRPPPLPEAEPVSQRPSLVVHTVRWREVVDRCAA